MVTSKYGGIKRVISVFLIAVMSLSLISCGTSESALSNAPGVGKWVDSDIEGTVKAEDEIRLQDDFAAAANKDWIINTPFDPDMGVQEALTSAGKLILERYQEILDDEDSTGANIEVLRTMRDLALDWDERNALGVEPLRKYIDTIESIGSIDEFTEYQASTDLNPFGIGLLMPANVESQIQFVDKSTLVIKPPTYSLGNKGAYLNFGVDTLTSKENNDETITYFLDRLGFEAAEIKAILKGNYNIETSLARAENTYGVRESFDKVQTTREDVAQYLNGYPLLEIIDGRGYSECDSINLDYMYLAGLKGIYNEAHLEDLKSFLIVHTVNTARTLLDRESLTKTYELMARRSGKDTDSVIPDDEMLFQNVLVGGGYIPAMDEEYLRKYFPDDEKIDEYTEIVYDLMDSYREMISEEDWLSEQTKETAIDKLDNMVIHVVRPDNTADYSDVELLGYAEGGNLLDAVAEGRRKVIRQANERAANPESDRYFWDIYDLGADSNIFTTNVNCFYMATQNAFYILAGWIAVGDYLYGDDATYEQLLGYVGAVAGHEISHGFDAEGSHYDKYGRSYDDNGLSIDWMDPTDRSRLDERSNKLASYLSLARPIPGKQAVNGNLVKNEAMADMGGVKAVLYMARKLPDFNYDEFFRGYAALWASKTTQEAELAQMNDVHPLNFYRINTNLQQFDEFLETYDINPGDGMYLAPEKRVNVW